MSFTLGNIIAVLIGMLLIFVGGVLVRAATLPTSFRISRSATVNATPDKVYPMVADLHRFNDWNPFVKTDPKAEIKYSGADQGVGAQYHWTSTGDAGVGEMIITKAQPQLVAMDLNFEKPFVARNKVEFDLAPQGQDTIVTWTMTGKMPFLHRVFSVFMSFDKMVGGEFAKGLADLRSRVS